MPLVPCPNCGKQISESAQACPHCGNDQLTACPDCGQQVSTSAATCPNCGSTGVVRATLRAQAISTTPKSEQWTTAASTIMVIILFLFSCFIFNKCSNAWVEGVKQHSR